MTKKQEEKTRMCELCEVYEATTSAVYQNMVHFACEACRLAAEVRE